MRRVVRCARCSLCADVRGCGFVPSDRLVCARTGEDVEADDGCTFGTPGRPRAGVVPVEVDIGQQKSQLCGW